MVFSFFVAVMLTPWLMLKIAGKAAAHAHHEASDGGKLGRAFIAYSPHRSHARGVRRDNS